MYQNKEGKTIHTENKEKQQNKVIDPEGCTIIYVHHSHIKTKQRL